MSTLTSAIRPDAPPSKAHYPFTTRLLLDLYAQGELPNVAELLIEPRYGYAGRLRYTNGTVRMIRDARVGLNNNGATSIATDKGYAKFFMQALGYATPVGQVFLLPQYIARIDRNLGRHGFSDYAFIESLYDYIEGQLGYPCYLKPNDSSQGEGVTRCDGPDAVAAAVELFQRTERRLFLAEAAVPYPDYRVVVLRDEVVACYLRRPLAVSGDGVASIGQLLESKQAHFSAIGRSTVIKLEDPRIGQRLARHNLTLASVLAPAEVYQVHDASNLSLGGEAEDYTAQLHPRWRDLCSELTAAMGLEFCGVDIACADLADPSADYSIIEINASPGMEHYASSGPEQRAAVRRLYQRIYNQPL